MTHILTRTGAAPTAFIAATLCLTACGPRNTDDILRGGVPARTNLPHATTLCAGSHRQMPLSHPPYLLFLQFFA